MTTSREYTVEEIKAQLIDHLQYSVSEYWYEQKKTNGYEGCIRGAAFSFLVALDGGAAALPGFIVVPEGVNRDIGGALHEVFPNRADLDSLEDKDKANFVRYVRERVAFWTKKAGEEEVFLGREIDGLIVDLLSLLDNKITGMPKYAVTAVGSEEAKQDYIEEGMDYYPINTDEQIAAGNIIANISGDLSEIYKLAMMPVSFAIVDGLELAKFELTRASHTKRDGSKVFVAANLPLLIANRLEDFFSAQDFAIVTVEGDARIQMAGNIVIKKPQQDGKSSYYMLKQDLLNLGAEVDSPQLGRGERGVAKESMYLPL